jgi:hypothetical protein
MVINYTYTSYWIDCLDNAHHPLQIIDSQNTCHSSASSSSLLRVPFPLPQPASWQFHFGFDQYGFVLFSSLATSSRQWSSSRTPLDNIRGAWVQPRRTYMPLRRQGLSAGRHLPVGQAVLVAICTLLLGCKGGGSHAQDPFFIEGREVTRSQRSVCSVPSASFLHHAYYILPTIAQKSLFESDGATVHLLSQRPALDERDSDDKVLFPNCSRWELLHRSIWCAALPHSLPLVRAPKGQACPAKGVKYHWVRRCE